MGYALARTDLWPVTETCMTLENVISNTDNEHSPPMDCGPLAVSAGSLSVGPQRPKDARPHHRFDQTVVSRCPQILLFECSRIMKVVLKGLCRSSFFDICFDVS